MDADTILCIESVWEPDCWAVGLFFVHHFAGPSRREPTQVALLGRIRRIISVFAPSGSSIVIVVKNRYCKQVGRN